MKTVVETFLTEETVDLIYDNEQLELWNNHVEELGLKGQTQIVKKDKSPIPFMHLKTSYKNICEVLCPRKVKVESYNITPIPVEILELIALSKKENYFSSIEIWYDEESPDPFCIGETLKWGEWNNYSYNSAEEATIALGKTIGEYSRQSTFYLLGKWADVKHSWDELKELAMKRYKEGKNNEYIKKIQEAKRGLEDLDIEAFEKFNGSTSNLPF